MSPFAETLLRFVHLAAVASWFGGCLFLFLLAPAVFAALPRPVAGDAMNAIFPRYYGLAFVSGGVALVTLLFLPERSTLRVALLAAMLALTSISSLVMGPRAHSLRIEIQAVEAGAAGGAAESGLEDLRSRFRKLHGAIMATDLAVLLAGILLVWSVASGHTAAGQGAVAGVSAEDRLQEEE